MSKLLKTLAVLLAVSGTAWGATADQTVLEYVRATRVQRGRASYTVDVTVSASIPALSKTGVLRAVKKQAAQGRLTYEPVVFQGDGLIKTNVIARYISAELEAQRPEEKLATEISPLNYRFILKGREFLDGHEALIYEVKPLHRRPGLFQGTVWLDRQTALPLKDHGKLVKLPSVWLKEVTFTREYDLVRGYAVPSRITSEVKTRLVGKARINVDFANYRFDESQGVVAAGAAADSNNLQDNLPK